MESRGRSQRMPAGSLVEDPAFLANGESQVVDKIAALLLDRERLIVFPRLTA